MTRGLQRGLPCPVCTVVPMAKAGYGSGPRLEVDHCRRCGGVWFDAGELQAVRRLQPTEFLRFIARRDDEHRMACHECGMPLPRDAERCAACGVANRLDCPGCARPMERAFHDPVWVDVCRDCRGVWLDGHELAALWSTAFAAALQRHRPGEPEPGAGAAAGMVTLDALSYDPFALWWGAHLAGDAIGAAAQGLAHAPELAVGGVEVAGEAAASVFEVIVEFIAGIFG